MQQTDDHDRAVPARKPTIGVGAPADWFLLRLILHRCLWAVPSILLITFVVYVAIRLGTDPAETYERANPRASAAKVREYRELNNLHDGAVGYVRGYVDWLVGFVTGDWPRSIIGRRAVWPELRDAMANTMRLGLTSLVVGMFIGISLGVAAAHRPGGRLDSLVNSGASVALGVPVFVAAVMFQLFFAVLWSKTFGAALLPTSGVYPPGHRGFDLPLMLKHMILPTAVVAMQIVSIYARFTRASLLDEMNNEYLRTARSKGISERRVLTHHTMRNALIPLTTVSALQAGSIVSGLVITENVFSYPGMGNFFLVAFRSGDFPQLMPFTVIAAVSVIGFNAFADVAIRWLDPRLRMHG